jgi:hypothetical protein
VLRTGDLNEIGGLGYAGTDFERTVAVAHSGWKSQQESIMWTDSGK